MSAKVGTRVDQSHPDFPEYREKCTALNKKYMRLVEQEEAKYLGWNRKSGIRNPAEPAIRELIQRRTRELAAIQTEYDYLFTIEPEEGDKHPD